MQQYVLCLYILLKQVLTHTQFLFVYIHVLNGNTDPHEVNVLQQYACMFHNEST